MRKNSNSRIEAENKEDLEVKSNELPDNRVQTSQQVQPTSEALNTKTPNSGFEIKPQKSKGSRLKQEAIADVLSGSGDSGMGIAASGKHVSGTGAGILTANNSTPIADKVRDRTRPGKKLDRIATKLNYTPSEQALVAMDESKPLADAADTDQGYNGTYRNEYAKTQKRSGAVPGDLLFQRSVDLITKDQLYFAEGQIVLPSVADATNYTPSKTYAGNGLYKPYQVHIGDFIHRALHAKVDEDGKVRYLAFDVDDITCVVGDSDLANKSSAARLTLSNRAELDRIAMDAKAGDEKADIWTPLARAVNEPTKTAYLLSMIEAQTGLYPYVAYSKAMTNFAFQLNRAPKDGQDIVTPAVEEVMGSIQYANTSTNFTDRNPSLRDCFGDYTNGNPLLMVAAYDSEAKFNNKADLLLQPRGWRMHLQTADNNINALRIPQQFVNVFADQEVFSTIGRDYDPLLPICMTDKAGIIDRCNMNELGGFGVGHFRVSYTGTNIEVDGAEDATVHVETLVPKQLLTESDSVWIHTKNSIDGANGLVIMANGAIGWKKDGTNRSNEVVDVLISHDSLAPTGYTTIGSIYGNAHDITMRNLHVREGGVNHDRVTAASWEIFYDDRFYVNNAGPYKYVYSDLRNNYVVEVKHPLVEGLVEYLQESIGSKFYRLLGNSELYVPWIFSTQYATLAAYILCAATPWIQRVRLNSMRDVIYYEDNVNEYPFSSLIAVKDAPIKSFLNFGCTGYDEPLECKKMADHVALKWVMPEFFWKVSAQDYVAPWYFNQSELESLNGIPDPQAAAMSMPSIRSGIRLGQLDLFYSMSEKDIRLSIDRMAISLFDNNKITFRGAYKYGLTTDGQIFFRLGAGEHLSILDILATPREIGLVMDAPGYVLSPGPGDVFSTLADDGTNTSFKVKVWTNKSVASPEMEILRGAEIDITRAANYAQKWFSLDANSGTSNTQILGLVFGANDEGSAMFSPFIGVDDESAVINAPTILSHQRSLWTRIQTLPFIISPFDAVTTTGGQVNDIYDLAYAFGLAGFRASDYRESVFNRSKDVVNQGMLFIDDPWVNNSPIVKHGASSTGAKITNGYTITQ